MRLLSAPLTSDYRLCSHANSADLLVCPGAPSSRRFDELNPDLITSACTTSHARLIPVDLDFIYWRCFIHASMFNDVFRHLYYLPMKRANEKMNCCFICWLVFQTRLKATQKKSFGSETSIMMSCCCVNAQ